MPYTHRLVGNYYVMDWNKKYEERYLIAKEFIRERLSVEEMALRHGITIDEVNAILEAYAPVSAFIVRKSVPVYFGSKTEAYYEDEMDYGSINYPKPVNNFYGKFIGGT